MKFSEKNKQINKETKLSFSLYIFFFIWWYVFAYFLGGKNVEEYTYVMGLPSWFFYSCILGYVVICILVLFVVKKFFKEIPFEDEQEK